MSIQRRFRLGFFAYLQGEKPPAEVYADALEVFTAADELGYDVGWVAQHHFGRHGGLPSPFVFFAALAERTRHIQVGTAIVALPLEHPIRLAEDAAVFESLFPGRLQFGLGTGLIVPSVLSTFAASDADRRALYESGISQLFRALDGQPLNDAGDVLHPSAASLRTRIWEAPGSPERVAEAARRGSGLLLSRVAGGAEGKATHEVQLPLVERYKAELADGVAPRIGLSRTVYPSRHPEIAYDDLRTGLAAIEASRGAPATGHSGPTDEELFARNNIHFGSPDAVIESLRREPMLDHATDLICQVQPGVPSLAQTLDAVELIATKVAPALGWRPTKNDSDNAGDRIG